MWCSYNMYRVPKSSNIFTLITFELTLLHMPKAYPRLSVVLIQQLLTVCIYTMYRYVLCSYLSFNLLSWL